MKVAEVVQFNRKPEGEGASLRHGATGPSVGELHRRLKLVLGADYHAAETPNHFDDWTEFSVQRFQKRCGIPTTGVVDGLTWQRLVEATGAGTVSRPNVRQGGAAAPKGAPAPRPKNASARALSGAPFASLSWSQRLLMLAGAGALVYVGVKALQGIAGEVSGLGQGQGIREKPLNQPPCPRAQRPPPWNSKRLEDAEVLAE